MRGFDDTEHSDFRMTRQFNTAYAHRAADVPFADGAVARVADVSGTQTWSIAMLCLTVHGPRGYSSG